MCQYFISSYGQIIFHFMEDYISFIHSPADRHLWCFCLLTIVNNAVMNIVMCTGVFICLGKVPRNRIAGLYHNSGFNSFKDLNFMTSKYQALFIIPC